MDIEKLKALIAALRAVKAAKAEPQLYAGPVKSMIVTPAALAYTLQEWESVLAHLLNTGEGGSIEMNQDGLWIIESALEWARRRASDNGNANAERKMMDCLNFFRAHSAPSKGAA